MKFINETSKVIPMKIDGLWKDIEPHEEMDLPEYNAVRQEGLVKVIHKKEDKKTDKKSEKIVEYLSTNELMVMNKDGLNDYAAKIGLDKVNTRDKKSKMIRMLVNYIKKLLKV